MSQPQLLKHNKTGVLPSRPHVKHQFLRHVLACVDASSFADAVLAHAAAIAMAAEARMTVVRVLEASAVQAPVDPVGWTLRHCDVKADLRERASHFGDLQAESVIVDGPAAERICAWARDNAVDLTVLGRGGESVWLAWFAAVCADAFADLAKEFGRNDLNDIWKARADDLRRAADAAGWDGAWYARAFADDGLPWGSKESDECQIDSISQSWAVLADGPSPERTAMAVAAATERLVDHDARLVRLLTPPFDRTPRDPGYIRAYPPGVRENGGQYTHAAAWLGLAHAQLGDGDRAYEIFDLINPIRRTAGLADAELYRAEPYVLAADVRGAEPGIGQAGWTWYTGAAGWTWQLAVEGILGLSLQGGAVRIAPRIPKKWGSAEVKINGPDGILIITIEDPERIGSGRVELAVDGRPIDGDCIAIPTDGMERRVTACLRPSLTNSSGIEHRSTH